MKCIFGSVIEILSIKINKMKKLLCSTAVLFVFAGALFSQKRTELLKTSLESKNSDISIYNEGNDFIIHNTALDKLGNKVQSFMLINITDLNQRIVSMYGIDKKNPFLFSPTFTKGGIVFFEAYENKKDNKIELYMHEIKFIDMTTSNRLIYSISGNNKDDYFFYYTKHASLRNSALYILFKGNEKQNAIATVVNLDLEFKIALEQEINFTGTIDPAFAGYVQLTKSGYVVSFHQIIDKKIGRFSEISVLNTNSRQSTNLNKFTVTANENESLTSHKIYIDNNDFIHVYGTIHKKNKDNEALITYRGYSVLSNKERIIYSSAIPITQDIKAHSLLTISPEYTVYVLEQGRFAPENGGMKMLGNTAMRPNYIIDSNDDAETLRLKEEEIRLLKEQGLLDNNQSIESNTSSDKSSNLFHIYCIGAKGDVLWSDVIRRNFKLTPNEIEKLDPAVFGLYIWAVGERLLVFYNDMVAEKVAVTSLSSNAQQEPQQKTVYREYNVKSNRFVERVLEPTEKSSLKYVYLPGLTLINQGQIIITMVKTEKGQYVPCKLIF
jgi:hypothetical protein